LIYTLGLLRLPACREAFFIKGDIMLKIRHLISSTDLTIEETDEILELADNIMKHPEIYSESCKGYLLATMFYEPSTRTRFSFEAAMTRLGGTVMGFADPESTSSKKGESIADTIRTISCYADITVMRHSKEGAPYLASKYSSIPVINAGDGGHLHPTQTLTDLLTIKSTKGSLEGNTIGLCGDLKFGRTVHSLVKALSRYKNTKFIFISPEELNIPDYVLEYLEEGQIEITSDLESVMPKLDILYMTRIQKERFLNEEEYLRLKGYYILDAQKMSLGKPDLIVLHPLPRVDEIHKEVDSDPRAVYFKQARFGMFARMALIMKLLGKA
jgi:aspartate carbamoyltransferase catalytic subunit